jgi:hypothetical protein
MMNESNHICKFVEISIGTDNNVHEYRNVPDQIMAKVFELIDKYEEIEKDLEDEE